ncbi:MAG: type II CRISPR-associated endonuclease Cas1 [Acidimicrobiia bacterium]|nr:type II CRISPR-associated endonuclease Cas1 [Acidimicrobiia bacterium]
MSRVVHVGDSTSRIAVRHHQLVAEGRLDTDTNRTAPLEDLDLVVLSTLNGLDLDLHAMQRAVEHGTGMVVCDENFNPAGILLPLFGAWNHTEVLHAQMATSLPRRKRAWQQVIRQKIRQQALSLDDDGPVRQRLVDLSEQVRSGDTSNTEATAARLYWPALMGSEFRRIPQTRTGINGALDYGYAIVRSLVARCIVGVGLHPALGIHHQSRSNPLCLADDLVEPLRPMVDRIVSTDRNMFMGDLDPDGKIVLRSLLDLPVGCGEHRGLLTTACERYVESFRGYLLGDDETIHFPEVLDQ